MEPKYDVERLSELAASDDEEPNVSTIDPQIRTTKFAQFPDPKRAYEQPAQPGEPD
jgi:hypothetical protein